MYADPTSHCVDNARRIVKCIKEVEEFHKMSPETLTDFISNELLPRLIESGETDAVMKVVNEFNIDFLKAGRMDYVGNGVNAGPGNYVLDNLVMLAMREGDEELVEFFLETLMNRGETEKLKQVVDDTDAWEIYEDLIKRRQRERVKIVRRALPANISYIQLPKYLEAHNYPQYSKKNITKLMGWSKPEKPGSAMYSQSGRSGSSNSSNGSSNNNNNNNNNNNTKGGKRLTRKASSSSKHRKAKTYRHRRQTSLRQ